jgi:hypothetical protein
MFPCAVLYTMLIKTWPKRSLMLSDNNVKMIITKVVQYALYNYDDDDCEFVNDFLVECFFGCGFSGSLSWILVGCRM